MLEKRFFEKIGFMRKLDFFYDFNFLYEFGFFFNAAVLLVDIARFVGMLARYAWIVT